MLFRSKIRERDFLFALMVSTIGDRPLGIQSSQLTAIARWLKDGFENVPVKIVAVGPRSSLISLVAAALEPRAIDSVELHGSFGSLREVVEQNRSVKDLGRSWGRRRIFRLRRPIASRRHAGHLLLDRLLDGPVTNSEMLVSLWPLPYAIRERSGRNYPTRRTTHVVWKCLSRAMVRVSHGFGRDRVAWRRKNHRFTFFTRRGVHGRMMHIGPFGHGWRIAEIVDCFRGCVLFVGYAIELRRDGGLI